MWKDCSLVTWLVRAQSQENWGAAARWPLSVTVSQSRAAWLSRQGHGSQVGAVLIFCCGSGVSRASMCDPGCSHISPLEEQRLLLHGWAGVWGGGTGLRPFLWPLGDRALAAIPLRFYISLILCHLPPVSAQPMHILLVFPTMSFYF